MPALPPTAVAAGTAERSGAYPAPAQATGTPRRGLRRPSDDSPTTVGRRPCASGRRPDSRRLRDRHRRPARPGAWRDRRDDRVPSARGEGQMPDDLDAILQQVASGELSPDQRRAADRRAPPPPASPAGSPPPSAPPPPPADPPAERTRRVVRLQVTEGGRSRRQPPGPDVVGRSRRSACCPASRTRTPTGSARRSAPGPSAGSSRSRTRTATA